MLHSQDVEADCLDDLIISPIKGDLGLLRYPDKYQSKGICMSLNYLNSVRKIQIMKDPSTYIATIGAEHKFI